MTLRDNFLYFILLELGLLGYLINDISQETGLVNEVNRCCDTVHVGS